MINENDLFGTHYETLRELLLYKKRFSIALKAAHICVFEVDLTRQLYTFFENAEDIFGVTGEEILRDVRQFSQLGPAEYQKAASDYFSHPDDADAVAKAFASILAGKPCTYEARMKAGETNYIWCKLDVTPIMENGIPVRMIGVITDIHELKAKAEVLKKEATLDVFTGLYNKKYAKNLIKTAIKMQPNQKHALIMIDLDNFKHVNDTWGHAEGDLVVQEVAENLKKLFRKTDILGRFGGDEFMILLKDIPDREFVIAKLQKLISKPTNKHNVTMSMGVAIYPDDAREFAELFTKADAALYEAKKTKNTFVLFESDTYSL